jgi:PAS domain S-box-containing protein
MTVGEGASRVFSSADRSVSTGLGLAIFSILGLTAAAIFHSAAWLVIALGLTALGGLLWTGWSARKTFTRPGTAEVEIHAPPPLPAKEETREQPLHEAGPSASEKALHGVLAHSPLILFSWDAEGIYTLAEGRGLESLGLDSKDLLGRSAIAKPVRLPTLEGPVRRVLQGLAVDEICEIAGSTFEIHLRAETGEDGKPSRASGLAVDVTARRKVEEDLRRSKERLRTVISNAPIFLFALDGNGTFTLAEGRGLEALGLKAGDLVGKSAADHFRQSPQMRINIRRALSGEEFTSTAEIGGFWFETYYSPVFKGYGEIAGVIGVAINVNDRKRAEDALRRSEDQLRHSRKMEAIGRVAGGVAHDFNNLLTAITGHAELLLSASEGRDDEPGRKSIEEIRRASDKASALTRQLLAFSRRQILTPKLLNLNSVLGDMDKMLRRLIREDIELITLLDPELGNVWVDPGQMEQVILNLALNARDAMSGGGQLTLETSNVELEGSYARGELFLLPGSYVMLSVSDTGMGMDEEVKDHLFEPFFTTKEEGAGPEGRTGLGLGLSAVYGIVKQSGGTIAVESEKGKGTTLKVFLPRADKAAMSGAGAPSEALKGEETVLLVEDEEAVRTLIREILRMHGYHVLEAKQGGEAVLVSQFHPGPIHMLLTDMVMANMSGRELADHLRPLRPEMRVLYISGYSDDTVVSEVPGVRGGPAGVDAAFLAKPFTPKTLALKVREVLDAKPPSRRRGDLVHRA